ncbi:hypothetical protein NIES2130_15860 [Scytonema sp. HK-05]|nr:hypothetical protein NIES2130_15860 [Scytonema sp. HK-05]
MAFFAKFKALSLMLSYEMASTLFGAKGQFLGWFSSAKSGTIHAHTKVADRLCVYDNEFSPRFQETGLSG